MEILQNEVFYSNYIQRVKSASSKIECILFHTEVEYVEWNPAFSGWMSIRMPEKVNAIGKPPDTKYTEDQVCSDCSTHQENGFPE